MYPFWRVPLKVFWGIYTSTPVFGNPYAHDMREGPELDLCAGMFSHRLPKRYPGCEDTWARFSSPPLCIRGEGYPTSWFPSFFSVCPTRECMMQVSIDVKLRHVPRLLAQDPTQPQQSQVWCPALVAKSGAFLSRSIDMRLYCPPEMVLQAP